MPVAKFRQKLQKRKLKAPELTDRQEELIAFVLRCLLSGYLPSYREIGEEMGISSPNGTVQHLSALERKGYLEIHHNQGYQLTDKAKDLVL